MTMMKFSIILLLLLLLSSVVLGVEFEIQGGEGVTASAKIGPNGVVMGEGMGDENVLRNEFGVYHRQEEKAGEQQQDSVTTEKKVDGEMGSINEKVEINNNNATDNGNSTSPPSPPPKRYRPPAPPSFPFKKLRILPIGDERLCGNSSLHRTNLAILREIFMFDGLQIEFVGTMNDTVYGHQHECHPKYSTTQFRYGKGKGECPELGCRLLDWKPKWTDYDAALVLMGTHDCKESKDPSELFSSHFENLERIVMVMRGGWHTQGSRQPEGEQHPRSEPLLPSKTIAKKVFVSHLPMVNDRDLRDTIAGFNQAISYLIAEVPDGGDPGFVPVSIVETRDIDPKTDLMDDDLTLNEEGHRKLAFAWYSALKRWMDEIMAEEKKKKKEMEKEEL